MIITSSLKLLALAFLVSAVGVHGDCTIGFNLFYPDSQVSFDFSSGGDFFPDSTCKINIEAVTTSCTDLIKCVQITLGTQSRKEKVAPWYLYGDSNGVVNSGTPQTGPQTLTACAFLDDRCTVPIPGPCTSVPADVEGGDIFNFRIIDAAGNEVGFIGTNDPTGPVPQVNFCYDPTGVGLTIEVFSQRCVNKVDLTLTGNGKTVTRTENQAPYYIFGDIPGGPVTFKSTFVKNTEYTIVATPNNDSTETITARFTLSAPGFNGCPP